MLQEQKLQGQTPQKQSRHSSQRQTRSRNSMAGQVERRHSPSRTLNRSRRENKYNSTCCGMRMDEGQQVIEYSEEVTSLTQTKREAVWWMSQRRQNSLSTQSSLCLCPMKRGSEQKTIFAYQSRCSEDSSDM